MCLHKAFQLPARKKTSYLIENNKLKQPDPLAKWAEIAINETKPPTASDSLTQTIESYSSYTELDISTVPPTLIDHAKVFTLPLSSRIARSSTCVGGYSQCI